jgi:exo-beta-1,3-glucanase (GH17 family)
MSLACVKTLRAALAAAFACLLVACGGGGTVPLPAESAVKLRALPADISDRKAVSYAPYRTIEYYSPGVPTNNPPVNEPNLTAHIAEDLALLNQGGFRLIRLFDSSDRVAKVVLQTLAAHPEWDIKVMLGIYIQSGQEAFSQAEIARGVALAKDPQFKNIVVAVSVGNETMVSWSFNKITPVVMAGHLKSVRDQITQPVTTDDNWAFFAKAPGEPNDPKGILATIDFVSMHTYPLLDTVPPSVARWDWKQLATEAPQRAAAMMDAALAASKLDYADVRAHLDSQGYTGMPIVIGETGWKALPLKGELSRAHPVNQKMMYARLMQWAAESKTAPGPKSIIYFASFDEPWKTSDNGWGLFTVERKARSVIQSLYPQAIWDTVYADIDALYAPDESSGGVGSASRYTVYADAVTAGEFLAPGIQAFGWDSPALAYAGEANPSAAWAGDVPLSGTPKGLDIGPVPEAGPYNYGWGLFLIPTTTYTDLSSFNVPSGRLNFSIKTTYPGKIEVGFFTGNAGDKTASDVYLVLDPAVQTHGYRNDGDWHVISIPISELIAAGRPAYDMPASALPDLTKVAQPFVIADRYDKTGKTPNFAGKNTLIFIDSIYWSK